MSAKSRIIQVGVLIVALLATLAWIWGNSFESVEASNQKSESIAQAVSPTSDSEEKSGDTNHFLRKLAHFLEFCVFGIELLGLSLLTNPEWNSNSDRPRWKTRLPAVEHVMLLGLLVALTDETIQIFNDRGSRIQDVWLDFLGVIVGVGILLGIRAMVRRRRKKATG